MATPVSVTFQPLCGTGPCVKMTEDTERGGFVFTSTKYNDEGVQYEAGQFYDYAEVARFFEAVRSGEADEVRLIAEAKATVSV